MGLGELGLLGLRVPSQSGGLEVSEETFTPSRASGEILWSPASASTSERVAAMLVQNELKQEYLPHLSNGQILLGVGFSHLRRAGDPLIVAVPATGG